MDQQPTRMQQMAVRWTAAQPAVAAFIASMVPDFHDSEDLLQLVAASVVAKYDDYVDTKPFVPWAIGIARLEVLNHRRKSARDRHVLNSEAMESVAAAYREMEGQWDDLKEALDACIKQSAGRSRQVLELRYLREMNPKDIAKKLSMSTNSVFVMLHRVRIALRNCIERRLDKKGVRL